MRPTAPRPNVSSGSWRRCTGRACANVADRTMTHALNIRKDAALDFLALGALVHRLDPGVVPFRKASSCSVHVSGGEFNCAANLADCFRLRTGIATAMIE